MLSLEVHLGVTVSPQTPFPTDFVTLPVSASHRRFGSLPLVAEEGHSRKKTHTVGYCIPDMLKQLHPRVGGLRWLGVHHVISQAHRRFDSLAQWLVTTLVLGFFARPR